jgi:hypothetical protein
MVITGSLSYSSFIQAKASAKPPFEDNSSEKNRGKRRRELKTNPYEAKKPGEIWEFNGERQLHLEQAYMVEPGRQDHVTKRIAVDGFVLINDFFGDVELDQTSTFSMQTPPHGSCVKTVGTFGDLPTNPTPDQFRDSIVNSSRVSYNLPTQGNGSKKWEPLFLRAKAVLKRFNIIGERHECEGMSVIRAGKGAPRQSWHTDYAGYAQSPFAHRHLQDGGLPFCISALVALDEHATLVILTNGVKRIIKIPKGGCCVFRGDALHCGSEYPNADCWRLHFYFSLPPKQDPNLKNPGRTGCLVPVDDKGNVTVHLYETGGEPEGEWYRA